MDMNEWKVFSRLVPTSNIHINELDMLGLWYFDTNHSWNHPEVSTYTLETAPNYIDYNRRSEEVIHDNTPMPTFTYALSHSQQLEFDIVLQHSQVQGTKETLRIIVQRTACTCKSYLISTIKKSISSQATSCHCPLLLLTPTCVASFNIHVITIYVRLQIPIKDIRPL